MRTDILYFDLGINANGDENGVYYVKLNNQVIKSGTHGQCDRFIKNYKPSKPKYEQLTLF